MFELGQGVLTEGLRGISLPPVRDRFIPLRKSDILDGLVADIASDEASAGGLRQFAHMLGPILHQQYFDELDRLREVYFYFDPEVDSVLRVDRY